MSILAVLEHVIHECHEVRQHKKGASGHNQSAFGPISRALQQKLLCIRTIQGLLLPKNGEAGNAAVEAAVKAKAIALCAKFPIYA